MSHGPPKGGGSNRMMGVFRSWGRGCLDTLIITYSIGLSPGACTDSIARRGVRGRSRADGFGCVMGM
eukprot:1377775-Prymnesium_polylepis.1